jgi:hypothetical protein
MSQPLPPEVHVETLPGGGWLVRLPRRDLSAAPWLPAILFVVGIGITAFMVFWTSGFAGGFQRVFGPWGLAAGLVALPGFLGAITLWGIAAALQFGRAEIRVSDGRLFSCERVGPFRWQRSVDAQDVRRLLVSDATVKDAAGNQTKTPLLTNFAAVFAERTNGKPFWLTVGYPRQWLLAIADQLAAELHTEVIGEPGTTAAPVEVVDVPSQPAGETRRAEQPADSAVVHAEIPGGFTLTVPPRGLWRGSSGLFAFSLFWLGFMVVFTAFWIFAAAQGAAQDLQEGIWFLVGIVSLFWAIGIGMLLAAINMGRRQAVIGVTNGTLKLMIVSLFGVTRRDWELADLETVRVGPSGMSVNDVPVLQLQIVSHGGQSYGLLTGRDVPELEWMATLLRQAVRPDAVAESEPFDEDDESDIVPDEADGAP